MGLDVGDDPYDRLDLRIVHVVEVEDSAEEGDMESRGRSIDAILLHESAPVIVHFGYMGEEDDHGPLRSKSEGDLRPSGPS